jgi:hypothetical protein
VKRRNPKTAALYDAADEARRGLKARIQGCERCGKRAFVLHEIPRAGLRRYVAGLPSCVLGLCDPGCHQEVSGWPRAKQLALLLISRAHDYDLTEYNRWAVARVTPEDVEAEIDGLLSDLARF